MLTGVLRKTGNEIAVADQSEVGERASYVEADDDDMMNKYGLQNNQKMSEESNSDIQHV